MNATFTRTNLPAPIETKPGNSRQALHPELQRDQAFEAHVLGQSGQRRGLRGGQPVLDAARTAYLAAEWRGAGDRRLPAGTLRAVNL